MVRMANGDRNCGLIMWVFTFCICSLKDVIDDFFLSQSLAVRPALGLPGSMLID